ncbi:hypothetical protein SEPCBS119000_002570 [Sporothrix epigloea]|uniref:PLC-like phosphodiesterase n=1 Tax=Sporothrix epigloea TaxID=1892477 RepID=A0ABP0DI57_9PEZI
MTDNFYGQMSDASIMARRYLGDGISATTSGTPVVAPSRTGSSLLLTLAASTAEHIWTLYENGSTATTASSLKLTASILIPSLVFLLSNVNSGAPKDAPASREHRTTSHLPSGSKAAHSGSGVSTITVCNGHAELCSRKYSNVSMVGAHNSPFAVQNNIASNQHLTVTQQLDDGIRFLQAQIQYPSKDAGTGPHFCHTSCALLDAGPITRWLTEVDVHPSDFVTILLGNGNYSSPHLYAPFIESTGIVPYAFVPPPLAKSTHAVGSMPVDDWPTLGAMLSDNKRVLIMLDYKANQTEFPWLLDEFAYFWETPFDPTVASVPANETLPCTVQRPPGLNPALARERLFLMNHNVNFEVSVLGGSVMVPAVALLNQSNAATGINSLGAAADVCIETWGRPPLILNVDYYNKGSPPGSVFEVAARLNGVVYNNTCCGKVPASVPNVGAVQNRPSRFRAAARAILVKAMWLL